MSRRTQFRLLVALTIVWAVWAGWSLLGRATPYELRVLDDLGEPIAAAVIDIDGAQVGTSADDGRVPMSWSSSSTVLEVGAPGHVSQMLTVAERPDGVLDVVLKARIMRGRVVDADGVALSGAVVTAGSSSTITDREGHFNVRGAEPGTVTVARPAWIATEFAWDGGAGETLVEMAPLIARAVHISGDSAAGRYGEFLRMAKTTELNALMIDLKDEEGIVWYETSNQTAIAVGANWDAFNLESSVTRAHDEGLYVIGRIVMFNDPIAARNQPEMAVWDTASGGPFNVNGQFFLDPTDANARQYGLDLAAEACGMGVDEIQFDYVRFTDTASATTRYDVDLTEAVRLTTIPTLLQEAVDLLHPMGCAVAADVFAFLTTAEGDGFIGQTWEDIAMIVDVVSPMVYPSHYGDDFFFEGSQNDHPGGVVDLALRDGIERLPRNTVVRPWLQDFGYEASQVRAEIASAEKHGLGWMLWNAKSVVSTDALLPAE